LNYHQKKTVEGFIGAAIATIITGFILAGVLRHYQFMICPILDYQSQLKCEPNPIFLKQPFHLPEIIINIFKNLFNYQLEYIHFAPIQIHAMVLSFFSSIIAPFGGFFASGLKRALKIKDFGDLIPGHGGMSDRMDCQTMMGVFTFIYLQTFIITKPYKDVLALMLLLNIDEQLKLFETLKQILNK